MKTSETEWERRFSDLAAFQEKYGHMGFRFPPWDRQWLMRFFELVAYRERYGHCNVPSRWIENPQLGSWVSGQREPPARLRTDRVGRLNEIGFVWNPRREFWERMLAQLAGFRRKLGHCDVPGDWPQNPHLAVWVANQRTRQQELSPQQRRRLESLGFDWTPLDTTWTSRFEELKAFKKRFGHCNVPQEWPRNRPLGRWVYKQRQWRDRLSADRTRQLESAGFDWDPIRSMWDKRIEEINRFKKQFGHCLVPDGWPENPQLAIWVGNLRSRKHTLSVPRRQLLEQIGLILNPYGSAWDRFFKQLEAFKKRFGHCSVPLGWSENPQLGRWVSRQRHFPYRLSPERKRRLEGVEFVWNLRAFKEQTWEERFRELLAFRRRYGHCQVPHRWGPNPALGRWVGHQRQRRELLPSEWERRLDRLGFDWRPRRSFWEEKYQELKAFKKKYGHSNVPRGWIENPSLAVWVKNQRRDRSTMSPAMRRRLAALGLDWTPGRSSWRKRLGDLKAFKHRFGHCNVPRDWPENHQLAIWVANLRKRLKLNPERKKQLDRLGMSWHPHRSAWSRRFEELKAFKKRFGHCNVPQAWLESPTLSRWVRRQQSSKDHLLPEQRDELTRLGFQWQRRAQTSC